MCNKIGISNEHYIFFFMVLKVVSSSHQAFDQKYSKESNNVYTVLTECSIGVTK